MEDNRVMPSRGLTIEVDVLEGYIPEKFGTQKVRIDADHPLAAKLVTELPEAKGKTK